METIALPLGQSFWAGDPDNTIFYAELSNPNGSADEYPDNNLASSRFDLPPIFDEPVTLALLTNNYGFQNTLSIQDVDGNTLLNWTNLQNNQVYGLNLDFPSGCYTIHLFDNGNDGLSYWANPNQGAGALQIQRQGSDEVLYNFEPEFGRDLYFSFGIDELTDNENPELHQADVAVYPVPASDRLFVETTGISGSYQLDILDITGRLIETYDLYGGTKLDMPVGHLSEGSFFARITNDDLVVSKRFIIQR